jgi:hypothetical protein
MQRGMWRAVVNVVMNIQVLVASNEGLYSTELVTTASASYKPFNFKSIFLLLCV